MAATTEKTIVIPSRLEEAPQVQQEVVDELQSRDYPSEAVFAVRLAMDEALSNAIRHGNGSDPEKTVTTRFTCTDRKITISIEDQGPGFVPDELPDPTAKENLERPHGRGVMLMNAYMTDVSYANQGRKVILTKHRDCQLPNREG